MNHRRTRYTFLMILVHYIKDLLSNNEDEDCEINLFQNDNSLPFMLNKYSFNPNCCTSCVRIIHSRNEVQLPERAAKFGSRLQR